MSRWALRFGLPAKSDPPLSVPAPSEPLHSDPVLSDRAEFLGLAERLMRPFLAAPEFNLRSAMPVGMSAGKAAPSRTTAPLEGLCRMIAGIAPALEAGVLDPTPWQNMLAVAFDPSRDGYLVCPDDRQTLVELALLAQAILVAPHALWHDLPGPTREAMLAAFIAARKLRAGRNNWLLFAAMVEAFLAWQGMDWDRMRVEYAVEQHLAWYKGDGVYGDGAEYHADYYNSIIIHPLLLDILRILAPVMPEMKQHEPTVLLRAQRHAETLERMIAPDGSFPPLGRSLAYRCGLFHHLARLALHDLLPASLPPAQIRTALVSVARRTLLPEGSFGRDGWLTIGLNGRDPHLGEPYVNSGSVYFASLVLLPLGLPEPHRFWSDPAGTLTQTRLWSGAEPIRRDKALAEQDAKPSPKTGR